MRKVMVLALCLSLAASFSLAREATLTRVDLDIMGEMTRPDLDCTVGNDDFDNIIGYYGTWWWGFEDYATKVVLLGHPASGCNCNQGWALRSITMLLALDVDTNIDVQVALLDGGTCLPGAEVYASAPYNITGIPEFAYYEINIPFDPMACRTLNINASYYLAFRFLDGGAAAVGLPVTDFPATCLSFNDWGSGWVDLVDTQGFVGNIMIWADVDCCWEGVQTEDSSLSEIKELFR